MILMMTSNIRRARSEDYEKRHIELYDQLTTVNKEEIPREKYESLIQQTPIFVVEVDNIIIGTITVLLETKIIHNLGIVAHIEDVVVDANHRSRGIGKQLLEFAVNYAKDAQCYKVILDCNDTNVSFYEKCGFQKKGNMMRIDLT